MLSELSWWLAQFDYTALASSVQCLPSQSSSTTRKKKPLANAASPHSMLYHPSAVILHHFQGAEDVLIGREFRIDRQLENSLMGGDARLPQTLVGQLLADPAPGRNGLRNIAPPPEKLRRSSTSCLRRVSRTGRRSKIY